MTLLRLTLFDASNNIRSEILINYELFRIMSLNLLKYNRHWEKNFRYSFPKKREIFQELAKSIFKKRIVELTGLRKSGKTTLLFQLINHLLEEEGVDRFHILYFTFDEEKVKIDDLLKNLFQQTQVDYREEKIYVFLDEIQKLPDFQNQLKVYYDLYPNIKFLISGSSSFFIKKKSQEGLADRTISFFLPPLNFREYLYFKDKSEIIKRPLLYQEEIKREFEVFLESQFIESIGIKGVQERKDYFKSIIRKIIFEDIPQIFPIENPEILFRIVKIIGQEPGILIDYQKLSREIGISNKTLSLYLFYLSESFLVKKIFNFSRNLITSEKKLKKFYLASPSFSWAMTDFIKRGKLAENLVISLNDYRFFWRDSYQHEVDFIQVRDKKIEPIEVKYKNGYVSKSDIKNLILFLNKFKLRKGIVVGNFLAERSEKINKATIKSFPIYFV